MSTPGSTPGEPLSGAPAALVAGLAAAAALVPALVVLLVDFARVRATPLRAAGFLSVPEREAVELNAVEFIAAAFEAAAFEAAEFEAAARWDAGSAAATDGLSKKSVFGRGAGIGPPSASPPLEPVPTITAACRIPTVRSRVLGDGAAFQCTTLHCNGAHRARGYAPTRLSHATLCGGCCRTDDAGIVAQSGRHHGGSALQQG